MVFMVQAGLISAQPRAPELPWFGMAKQAGMPRFDALLCSSIMNCVLAAFAQESMVRQIDNCPEKPMKHAEITNTLSFLRSAEKLKDVLRSAHTSGGRKESTAEHSWRLCLWAMVFANDLGDIDMTKLLKICIIHDLGEALSGDVPATEQSADDGRAEHERQDLLKLTETLSDQMRTEIIALWDEYAQSSSPEGRVARGLDKLETIMQHNQGENPDDFDYQFNLSYGQKHMAVDPLIGQIRALLDVETKANIENDHI